VNPSAENLGGFLVQGGESAGVAAAVAFPKFDVGFRQVCQILVSKCEYCIYNSHII
jgi:hypothetical protein